MRSHSGETAVSGEELISWTHAGKITSIYSVEGLLFLTRTV